MTIFLKNAESFIILEKNLRVKAIKYDSDVKICYKVSLCRVVFLYQDIAIMLRDKMTELIWKIEI